MSLLRNITSGLRSLFRQGQVDRELDEELRAYQEMAAEQKVKAGMSRTEALRAVRLERGNLEVTKEIIRSGGWARLGMNRSTLTFRMKKLGILRSLNAHVDSNTKEGVLSPFEEN